MTTKTPFSQWRKIAMTTWNRRNDSMIYATMDIDFTKGQEYLDAVRRTTGVHVTPVHLVGKAVARVLEEMPNLNGRILWGSFVPSPTIDVFFTVSLKTEAVKAGEAVGTDLSGTKVARANEKTPWEIAQDLESRAGRIRTNQDPQFKLSKMISQWVPPVLLRPMLAFTTFVTEDLQLPFPLFALEARPFGSFLVTNVGTFGLDSSFAPLPNVARLPGLIVVGHVTPKPVVRDGEIVIRPILPLGASIDHRFIDGYQGAIIARIAREYLEDPGRFDPVPATPPVRAPRTAKAAPAA